MQRAFWLGVILVLAIAGCKKDEDTSPPSIVLDSPFENANFQLPDTIPVRGSVTDDRKVESVSIILLNQDLIPVGAPISVPVSGTRKEFNVGYPIVDQHLESSTYFIRVKASDGTQEASAYVGVGLQEVPREWQGLAIVSTTGSGSNEQVKVDLWKDGSVQNWSTVAGDFSASVVSSRHQYINIIGESTGAFRSIGYESKAVEWEVPVVNANFPTFTHVDLHDEVSYACYRSGRVEGYNQHGVLVFSIQDNPTWYPVKAFVFENVVITQQEQVTGVDKQLSWHFLASGTEEKFPMLIDFDVVEFFGWADNEVLIFCNEGSDGRIKLLFNHPGSLSHLRDLDGGNINDVVQIDAHTYIIAHDLGVYQFRYGVPNDGLITLVNGTPADRIAWDELTSTFYISSGNTVKAYAFSFAGATFLNELSVTDPVVDLHPFYNK